MIDTSKKPEYVVIVIGKKGSGKSTILNNLIQTKIFLDEKEENSIGIISHFFQRKKKEPLYSLYELQSEIYEINHNYLEEIAACLIELRTGINLVIVTISITELKIDISPILTAVHLFGVKVVKRNMLIVLTQKGFLNENEQHAFDDIKYKEVLIKLCSKKNIKIDENKIMLYEPKETDFIDDGIIEIKNRIINSTLYYSPISSNLHVIKSDLEKKFEINKNDLNFLSLLILAKKSKNIKAFLENYLDQCDDLDENAQNIAAAYEFSKSKEAIQCDKPPMFSSTLTSSSLSQLFPKSNESWIILDKKLLTPSYADYKFSNDQIKRKDLLIKRLCTGIKVGIKAGTKCTGEILKYNTLMPIVGGTMGVAMATIRIIREEGIKNKITKGGLELLSGGINAFIPGIGTVISIYVDGLIGTMDETEELEENNN